MRTKNIITKYFSDWSIEIFIKFRWLNYWNEWKQNNSHLFPWIVCGCRKSQFTCDRVKEWRTGRRLNQQVLIEFISFSDSCWLAMAKNENLLAECFLHCRLLIMINISGLVPTSVSHSAQFLCRARTQLFCAPVFLLWLNPVSTESLIEWWSLLISLVTVFFLNNCVTQT